MELTEARRQNLLVTLAILSLLCFFSSFLLFVLAINIKVTIDARMALLESYDSSVIPAVFLVVGMLNLAQNSACTYVNFRMRQPDNREKLLFLMLIILASGVALVIVEVSTAIAALVHIGILSQEFGKGVRKAMAEYSVGEELKREMDYVQIFYNCCGDLGYADWFKYFWSDKTAQPAQATSVADQLQLGDGVESLNDETPFSCCDWHSPRPCIHHHVHDNKRHHRYDYKKQTTLYGKGCREALIDVYSGVLRRIGLIGFAIAAVQICVLLLFRLLHTSLLLAAEAGNWTATTEAYLYFRTVNEDEGEKDIIEDVNETDKESSDEDEDEENDQTETDADVETTKDEDGDETDEVDAGENVEEEEEEEGGGGGGGGRGGGGRGGGDEEVEEEETQNHDDNIDINRDGKFANGAPNAAKAKRISGSRSRSSIDAAKAKRRSGSRSKSSIDAAKAKRISGSRSRSSIDAAKAKRMSDSRSRSRSSIDAAKSRRRSGSRSSNAAKAKPISSSISNSDAAKARRRSSSRSSSRSRSKSNNYSNVNTHSQQNGSRRYISSVRNESRHINNITKSDLNTNRREQFGRKKYMTVPSSDEVGLDLAFESDASLSGDNNKSKYQDFFHKMKSVVYNNMAHSRNSKAREFPRYEYVELKKRNKGRNRSSNYNECASDESDSSESYEEQRTNSMNATLL